ncbi:MAG: YCF48-related protein [Blastocatellia bacterium]
MHYAACRSIVLTISLSVTLGCVALAGKLSRVETENRAAASSGAAVMAEQHREGEFREGGFHGVAVVDQKNLWAVGLEGDLLQGSQDYVILHSTDSGFSWTRNLLMPRSYFRDVCFQNDRTGWVVGADEQGQGLILRTTDGGRNWIRQQSNAKSTLWLVRFISETTGWAAGRAGRVLRTTDGGGHWLSLRLPFGWLNDELKAEIRDLGFADEANGWIVGEMGRVYQSTDGGASWQSRSSEFTRLIKVPQPWRVDFKRVNFFNKNLGFMIAEVNDQRDPNSHPSNYLRRLLILRTENGGRDWKVRRTIETPMFVAAQFLTQDEWWIRTASTSTLFHTTDGGKTWIQVSLTRDARDGPLVFLNSNTGWVFSFQSGFWFPNLLTRDGGKTWTTQTINYITDNRTNR